MHGASEAELFAGRFTGEFMVRLGVACEGVDGGEELFDVFIFLFLADKPTILIFFPVKS